MMKQTVTFIEITSGSLFLSTIGSLEVTAFLFVTLVDSLFSSCVNSIMRCCCDNASLGNDSLLITARAAILWLTIVTAKHKFTLLLATFNNQALGLVTKHAYKPRRAKIRLS